MDDGVSVRVGLLRGYGNAIVPQAGAAFLIGLLGALDSDPERAQTRTTARTTCTWPGCGRLADDRGWWRGEPTCAYHWSDDGPWDPDR